MADQDRKETMSGQKEEDDCVEQEEGKIETEIRERKKQRNEWLHGNLSYLNDRKS